MRILYLCDKGTYVSKMSRVRFHSIDAIKRYPGVKLKKHGPGWGGFDIRKLEKNYKPDLIVWYKPLQIPGYAKAKTPKCIRYNEQWQVNWTKHEIKTSDSRLVIAHHMNDVQRFDGKIDYHKYKLVHNPHCAEKTIFKDYKQEKSIDVLLIGTCKPRTCYPLRYKFENKVHKYFKKMGIKFHQFHHPGYSLNGLKQIERHTIDYAKAINRAKIVVTCASDFHYALAKYSEVPLCRTALAADCPRENSGWYRKWMIKINKDDSAETMASKLRDIIKKKEWRDYAEKGYVENLKHRTQEDYSRRFIHLAEEFLNGNMKEYNFGQDQVRYLNGGQGAHE